MLILQLYLFNLLMKSRVFRIFSFFTASFIVCIAPSLAFGQWHPDSSQNTPVCDTNTQQQSVQGCTDGANGAILAWQDNRGDNEQIFAQRLDSNGRIKWNRTGLLLAAQPVKGVSSSQTNPIITTDDSGGAYVVWSDSRYSSINGSCLFAQHILANGTLAYPDTGLPVAIGLNGCQNPTLCDDGFGGAYVSWEDNRACNAQTRPDIWMNRLWRNGVKYGLTTAGPAGVLSSVTVNIGTYYKPKYVTTYYFHDPNANFECYMVGLDLNIPGKGSYVIDSISSTSDTQVYIKTHPDTGTYAYSVENMTGLAIDTMPQKQVGPAIINDGKGGAFLAWTSDNTSPNAIYGTHLDSTCTTWWDPAPQPGFQLYINPNTSSPSKSVALNRDGNQLLLSWEVINAVNNSEQIFAERMRNIPVGTGPGAPYKDTAFVYGFPVQVASNPIQQINPMVFSDDSVDNVNGVSSGDKGLLVPFIDQEQGETDYFEISAVRVLGDGIDLLPPAGSGFWYFEQKPHMHNDFKAVTIADPANGGSNNGLLAVWDDAWDGTDTMLYAQRIDRVGRKYFPTPGTSNSWGLCIAGNADSSTKHWSAKQPTLIPRTDGALVAWTDLRSGTDAIYAQLILANGSLWIPSDTSSPELTVTSTTPSDNDSLCNSQCTTVFAKDTGTISGTGRLLSGFDSVIATTTNMTLETSNFHRGADTLSFTVCVTDSFENGSATVTVEDTSFNQTTMNFTYCTIADTSHPTITWDTLANLPNPNWLAVHISDNGPWERGLSSVVVTDSSNIRISDSGGTFTSGEGSLDLTVSIVADSAPGQFFIKAVGVDGIASQMYKFYYTPGADAVNLVPSVPISISVFPNPTDGDATVQLSGAPDAEVTVLDVLGRTVGQFQLEGAHVWQASSLAPGTYILRAVIGDSVICKRIIRE
jgi:hypothetical protein